MPSFDPNNPPGKREGSGGGNDPPLPAGEYLIAAVWTKLQERKNGTPELRCKYQVVAGPAKGRTFFDSVSLNMESSGAMFRLSLWCKCVGQAEAFELKDAKELRRVFLGKPFKAKISKTQNGQYTNNGVERYLTEMTPAEKQVCVAWVGERQEEIDAQAAADGYSDDDFRDDSPPPSDDDFMGGSGGGTAGGADDEIPF